MKKTKILALGLAALMGLAPVTACSQGGSGESSEPQSSQTESAGGENNSGADQPEKHWTIYTIRSEDLPSYQCLDYVLEKYKAEVNPNVSWDHIYICLLYTSSCLRRYPIKVICPVPGRTAY